MSEESGPSKGPGGKKKRKVYILNDSDDSSSDESIADTQKVAVESDSESSDSSVELVRKKVSVSGTHLLIALKLCH